MTLCRYYRWPFLIGGPADGEPVPDGAFDNHFKVVTVQEETYYWRRHNFGPAIMGYYLAKDWPKERFSPYEFERRVFQSHPDLVEVSPHAEGDQPHER